MKKVTVVGLGVGLGALTAEGRAAIEAADVLIGAKRLVEPFKCHEAKRLAEPFKCHEAKRLAEPFKCPEKPVFEEYAADRVAELISASAADSFCVVVSGDVGFYSAARGLADTLSAYRVRFIPGVSSASCFFARLGKPWQDAALISCHGKSDGLVDTVRRSAQTFVLTGGNVPELSGELSRAGFDGLTAYAGEKLGLPGERIFSLPVSELASADIGALAVLMIENPGFDDRVRAGIPDGEFIRGGVPMTKAELRAVIMSRLAVRPADVCCDFGAGTGSVTVEMALAAYKGRVIAVDRNEAAADLIRRNCRAFHIGNVKTITADVSDALFSLPAADAAFIGGARGKIGVLLDALTEKNPRVRTVISAVTLETLHEATRELCARGMTAEISQLCVSRAAPVGETHMLEPLSPVFVISGEKRR